MIRELERRYSNMNKDKIEQKKLEFKRIRLKGLIKKHYNMTFDNSSIFNSIFSFFKYEQIDYTIIITITINSYKFVLEESFSDPTINISYTGKNEYLFQMIWLRFEMIDKYNKNRRTGIPEGLGKD